MRRSLWYGVVGVVLAGAAAGFVKAATRPPDYNVKHEVVVTGKVLSVTTIPDWMGNDGVNIALQGPETTVAHVDVATAGFLQMFDFGISVGDDLKLTGCWSEAPDGSPVFLVHEVTKRRLTLNVRDPSGRPLW